MQFPSGTLALKGTVQVPEGPPGRRPAVVLVHGGGPQSRDCEVSGQLAMGFGCSVEVFEDLADGLEAAGYVVLRYDKRTCGPFNDCADNGYPWPSVTHVVGDLVKDAAAAARWLAKQREVDPKRIYVVGHSEGGQLVPRLLADVPELRAGVMLAAPYSPVDMVLAGEIAFLDAKIRQLGQNNAEIDKVMKGLMKDVDSLRALRAGTFGGATIMGAPAVYWKSAMKADDEAPRLAVDSPKAILALSGDYDWNVTTEETALWAQAFATKPNPAHQTKVIPCVTHALNCIRAPDPSKIRRSDIDCEVDARVIEAVVAFLDAH